MKITKKFVIILVAIVFIISASFLTIILTKNKDSHNNNPPEDPKKSYVQNINYSESLEKINNPDQGFYRPILVRLTEGGATYNKNIIIQDTQLYHLRIDISAFSKAVNSDADKPLSSAALSGLKELLAYLKSQSKNAIVRFAYDPNYGGQKDKEPQAETIYQHITQVSKILNEFQSTITAIEVGLIGPWGEMHSSAMANSLVITPIIKTFLSNTTNLPVLARTPKMIYDFLGITINEIESYEIKEGSEAYRLGIYNDGYLGSDTDLGTYTNRAKDIEFLSKQTSHLPFGGEVVVPESKLHDIEVCLPEMFKINLNYLNYEWNNYVIDKWENSLYNQACGQDSAYYNASAFKYIENHMGYRFVLKNSLFSYSKKQDKLDIELSIKNVGFGNLNKEKYAKIIFVNDKGEVVLSKQVNSFSGSEKYSCSLDLNLENGNYSVYFSVYGDEHEGSAIYDVQFANAEEYNSQLKANKIGQIEIKR